MSRGLTLIIPAILRGPSGALITIYQRILQDRDVLIEIGGNTPSSGADMKAGTVSTDPHEHYRYHGANRRYMDINDTMKRTYRYRIYPKKDQLKIIDGQLWLCKNLYYLAPGQRWNAWQMSAEDISCSRRAKGTTSTTRRPGS